LYICGLILKQYNMKKLITFSFLLATAITAVAQVEVSNPLKAAPTADIKAKKAVVDEHAGHNHGPLAAPPAAVAATPTAVAPIAKPAAMLEEVLALKETSFDFGKIPQGKPVTHIFTVTNTGKMAFKLDNVQASCGCTTPQWDKEKMIEAGKSMDITVGYNAAAAGPFTKPVTITYNNGQSKVLNISGEVWATPAASAPANDAVNELKN
jgi:Protein of unknown function (DUF1573)